MSRVGGRAKKGIAQKEQQQMENEVYEFLLMGYSRREIVEYLALNYNLNELQAIGLYDRAHNQILELGDFDIERIITQHVAYYEEAARYLDSIGDFNAKSLALNAKEKLLKLFEEDQQTIDIDTTINIDISQLDYDMSKLESKEQDRFQTLFQKVRELKS